MRLLTLGVGALILLSGCADVDPSQPDNSRIDIYGVYLPTCVFICWIQQYTTNTEGDDLPLR